MWLFSPLEFLHTHTQNTLSLSLSLSLSCTITHISGICRHTTMKELTFYQITLFTDCLKTLFNYLHPQHYACVDEYWNCSADWMPYYILHRYNGAHHCVCVYALSDDSCHCMPYYIHHSYTGSLNYSCIGVLLDDPFDWIRSPLCMRVCLIRLLLQLNALLHTSQTEGRSPLCMRLWIIR